MASGTTRTLTVGIVIFWVAAVGVLTAWAAGYFDGAPEETTVSQPDGSRVDGPDGVPALPPGHPAVPGYDTSASARSSGCCPPLPKPAAEGCGAADADCGDCESSCEPKKPDSSKCPAGN